MKNVKLVKVWDALHTSYWFLPGILAISSIILAVVTLTLDHIIDFNDWDWLYAGGPEGSRAVLSAIASSMISVTATSFSITIVAMQLASSTFGPRLLRNFMKDTGNQIVLGVFIGTFIYSLLVLRAIYNEDFDLFVPHLSVTVGLALAILSIGVLIYFIHHASTIIQVSHVLQSVSDDLDKAIERLFPEKIGVNPQADQPYREDIPPDFSLQAYPIKNNKNGYLQAINNEKLMEIARQYDLLVHVKFRPGNFVVKGSELVMVWPGVRVNNKLKQQLQQIFIIGKERTEQQDIEFPIQQLVEIALRAISPGINDPFTAIRCIDRLSAGLCYLVQRQFPSSYRYDYDNQLRVMVPSLDFEGIVDQAFNQIRQYSNSDAAVTIRLLEAIALVATHTQNPQYREVLRRHADMIERGSHEGLPESQDRKDVYRKYDDVIQSLAANYEM
ncbi:MULTISPECIES: DUF2254 domain-containing protein [unclassified Anabaena]|uniref:DUF2254 domain-containing protein n=1 Tax=unclassified Anabaena TaxID=2619674 RepID=UPI0039C6B500